MRNFAIAVLGAATAWTTACVSTAPGHTGVTFRGARGAGDNPCRKAAVALQVLGSGGPIGDDGRASSGYVVWVGGKSRLLVDAGGGVSLRFAEAGASLADLDGVLLSHVHVDHTAALPALLKSGFFLDRARPLLVAGPGGNEHFPATDAWLDGQIGPDGAYRYLAGYRTQAEGWFPVTTQVIPIDDPQRVTTVSLASEAALVVTSIPVRHGIVPAVAFRVEVGSQVVVLGGDQDGKAPAFAALAKDADLLVLHHAIPEGATGVAADLHARPSQLAAVAAAAAAKHVVLSHHMGRSLADLPAAMQRMKAAYGGPISVASDLDCFVLSP